MSDKQDSSDWLKVLATVALFTKEVRADVPDSAYYVAVAVVLLSIWSKGFFKCFYVFVVGWLSWFAWQVSEPVLFAYAAGYMVMGVLYFVEDERRRSGQGQFLSAAWWVGQSALCMADLRFAAERSQDPGFFTILFLVIGICMTVKELVLGIRASWRRRTSSESAQK